MPFQRQPVRASIGFYSNFTLTMGRSLGFGSITCNSRPIKTRFPFGFVPSVLNLATYNNSPDRSTKSTISHINVLYLLVNTGFQVLFHSPPGVLFTFPSRYCSSIGHQVVFRLGGWAPDFPRGYTCPAVLWIQLDSYPFRLRGSHTLWPAFPCRSTKDIYSHCCP